MFCASAVFLCWYAHRLSSTAFAITDDGVTERRSGRAVRRTAWRDVIAFTNHPRHRLVRLQQQRGPHVDVPYDLERIGEFIAAVETRSGRTLTG